ncbi:MAG: type toxin-antitoxin system mRNA interferase toxin, RelE/StbE family [Ignavibacteria bacterium]|nr:type toxin-antitoxin system mRNA interferase toxin, RelE/StbE family [Ignavibacteria bacterium]
MKNLEEPEKEAKDYNLVIKKSPKKFLEKLDDNNFDKIDDKILGLKSEPYPRNSKKLIGFDCYRVRVGDYRILYTVNAKEFNITILDINNRKDVYKKKK